MLEKKGISNLKALRPRVDTVASEVPGLPPDSLIRALVVGGVVEGWLRATGLPPTTDWFEQSFPRSGSKSGPVVEIIASESGVGTAECDRGRPLFDYGRAPPLSSIAKAQARWFSRRLPEGLELDQVHAMVTLTAAMIESRTHGLTVPEIESMAISVGEEWMGRHGQEHSAGASQSETAVLPPCATGLSCV